jgi:thymidylate kinase
MPDAVIFLDTPPAVSMARIRNRGEKMQVHETEEKLASLRQAYLLVTETTDQNLGLPTFVLDGDRDLDTIVDEARRAVESARAAGGKDE